MADVKNVPVAGDVDYLVVLLRLLVLLGEVFDPIGCIDGVAVRGLDLF